MRPRWKINVGIRLPCDENHLYKKWLAYPKILTSWDLTQNSTVNASYNFQQQSLQLLGFTDLVGHYREFYITAEEQVDPSSSHQWSAGYFRSFDRWRSEERRVGKECRWLWWAYDE